MLLGAAVHHGCMSAVSRSTQLMNVVTHSLQANVDLTDLARDDCQQTITLTVMDGPPQTKTKQDVTDMSFPEFAVLTAVSHDGCAAL